MIDLGHLGRPRRAILPEGNVQLADGRMLPRDALQSRDMIDMMVNQGYRGAWAVYHTHGKHELLVIAAVETTPRWGPLLHVSLSYSHQYPSWRDIKLIKEAFYGDERDAMMVLPREADYIALHPNCFHLWETPQAWGLR